jgi:hypothetical protein
MTRPRAVVNCRAKSWEHGQLYMVLSRARSPDNLCILLPEDMDSFIIHPPVDVDVVRIVETMQSSKPLPIPHISPGDNVESSIASVNPSHAALSNELPCHDDYFDTHENQIVFPASIMMPLKYLIRTRLRFLLMVGSCHGSLRTNRPVDSIVSERSDLKLMYSDLLCLLRRFSVGYFRPAAQKSYR